MNVSKVLIASIGSIALAAWGLPAAASTLSTPLAGGNSQNGIMFDVATGASALTLQSIGVNINSGTYDFEFYTHDGAIGGDNSNAGAWTLRGTFSGVATAGSGNITTFDFADFGLAANSAYGLYLTTMGDGNVNYTNGSAVGDVIAANADLSIMSGYGKSYPFGSSYSPRNFNGELTYALGGTVPEPATWALMIGGFGMTGFAMRRRKSLLAA
ncbi:PEPxxWA-CTERM sorting domain-containing protein [Glacieibacterium sp.]|uniref:PEPxxWA-CTERM sorting domain-containing protein n=1 Tax=Glacieibacterium sp. TaxID=2860237 RepID=UPI003B009252